MDATIVELYGNAKDQEASTWQVGFDDNKDAYRRDRLDIDGKWDEWRPIGNSTDYESNAVFAELNGALFKYDNGGS